MQTNKTTQAGERMLTKKQKASVIWELLVAAGDLAEHWEESGRTVHGIHRDDAAKYLAQLLKNLPGTQWDNRLPQI